MNRLKKAYAAFLYYLRMVATVPPVIAGTNRVDVKQATKVKYNQSVR